MLTTHSPLLTTSILTLSLILQLTIADSGPDWGTLCPFAKTGQTVCISSTQYAICAGSLSQVRTVTSGMTCSDNILHYPGQNTPGHSFHHPLQTGGPHTPVYTGTRPLETPGSAKTTGLPLMYNGTDTGRKYNCEKELNGWGDNLQYYCVDGGKTDTLVVQCNKNNDMPVLSLPSSLACNTKKQQVVTRSNGKMAKDWAVPTFSMGF